MAFQGLGGLGSAFLSGPGLSGAEWRPRRPCQLHRGLVSADPGALAPASVLTLRLRAAPLRASYFYSSLPLPTRVQADQQTALTPHFSREERCMKVAFERASADGAPHSLGGTHARVSRIARLLCSLSLC